jgi:hypothetical protein
MLFRQMFDNVSGTYSYLLASRPGGEALIIDPVLEKVDRYIQLLRDLDLRLCKSRRYPPSRRSRHRSRRTAGSHTLHNCHGRADEG